MVRQALAAAGVLIVFGCTQGTVLPPVDAGTAALVGRNCNVDAECGALRCDKVRRQCICLSDESCKSTDMSAPAKYCNNYTGLCVEEIVGCKGDADCANTEFCDSSTRTCRALKSFCELCTSNSECGGAGDNCVEDANLGAKFCGKACSSNADCARGAACVMKDGSNQCWPATSPVLGQTPSCKNFTGCTPNSLRTCNATADCGDASQRCDPAKGKCVAVDQVCPFGTTCDPRNKICVADCAADADCGDAKLRCINRVCEPIGECTVDSQCPANKICAVGFGQMTGQCVPFCTADAECGIGQTCQKVGTRYRCAPGCNSNLGCALDQRCNATTKQCEGPQLTTGGQACQATAACSSCETCNIVSYQCQSAKPTFPHCASCSVDGDCTGGKCVLLADGLRYCAKFCGQGQECPQGFVCQPAESGQNVCAPSNRLCAGKCP